MPAETKRPIDDLGLAARLLTASKAMIKGLYHRSPRIQSIYRTYAARYTWPWIRHAPYSKDLHRAVLRSGDPTRYAAIALALTRVNDEGVHGSIAELGVFRGDLSVFLLALSGDRTLYLFDTFEGFPDRDAGEFGRMFENTSIEHVRNRLHGAGNVDIRKGYFPDTAAGLEDQAFAFVSLDADLYNPTLAGLRFFWPRLSPGGYLFLHDYHSGFPVADAVREFGLRGFVELPDKQGSIVVRKPMP